MGLQARRDAQRHQGHGAGLAQQALQYRQGNGGDRKPGRIGQRLEHLGLENPAHGDVGRGQYPARAGQGLQRHATAPGQCMRACGHHHGRVGQQRLEDEGAGQQRRLAAEHRVQPAAQQLGQQPGAGVFVHIDMHLGMLGIEPRQQGRKNGQGCRRNGAQAQRGRGAPANGGQRFRHLLQRGQHAAHRVHQGLAGQRGAYAARMALEQADVEHALHLGQRLGGCRLAHVQRGGGLHHRAALLQRHQQLQLSQAHMLGQAREQQPALGRGRIVQAFAVVKIVAHGNLGVFPRQALARHRRQRTSYRNGL